MRLRFQSFACLSLVAASACSQPMGNDAALDASVETSLDSAMETSMVADVADRVPYDVGMFQRTIDEATAETGRRGCQFRKGAMPWETLGREVPIGSEIPVKHWIILMQENRSFDSYFGTMPAVDGLPANTSNPNAMGQPVASFHQTAYCTVDTSHSWNGAHREWNNGANDGFVTTNNPNGERAMGYYDNTDLPFYHGLAQTFAMSDKHFCSLLGPTWVNREYSLAGTSFGLISNVTVPPERSSLTNNEYVIFQQLDRANVSWKVYYSGAPFTYGAFPNYALRQGRPFIVPLEPNFARDLAAGTLPTVVWIDPMWSSLRGVDATDEHPNANIQRGQAFIAGIIQQVMASSSWRDTAIILTYDEWGGFYDHVPPPEACHPGDFQPDLTPTSAAGNFDRLGFRVPMIVVSPWSKRGYVSHHITDHSSILRLLQTAFLLPALTNRDANAWPLLDLFDFSQRTFETPPSLPQAVVNQAQVDACHAAFP